MDGHEIDIDEHQIETPAKTILTSDQKSKIAIPNVALQMKVADIRVSLPDSHPKITLEELSPPHRRLVIKTGAMEGIMLSYAQNKIQTKRPLTHLLILDILKNFSLTVEQVLITKAIGDLFLTEIVISGPKGQRNIDARPSDALTIALYHSPEVPIMVNEDVLVALGY